jgi:hypothetical protein
MSWRVTGVLVAVILAALLADAGLLAAYGHDATITATVRRSPSLSGFAGIGLGYLICHFWG